MSDRPSVHALTSGITKGTPLTGTTQRMNKRGTPRRQRERAPPARGRTGPAAPQADPRSTCLPARSPTRLHTHTHQTTNPLMLIPLHSSGIACTAGVTQDGAQAGSEVELAGAAVRHRLLPHTSATERETERQREEGERECVPRPCGQGGAAAQPATGAAGGRRGGTSRGAIPAPRPSAHRLSFSCLSSIDLLTGTRTVMETESPARDR
jgi:hypothetical protein